MIRFRPIFPNLRCSCTHSFPSPCLGSSETSTQLSKRFFKRPSHATRDNPAVSAHLKDVKPDETREVLDIFQCPDVRSFTKMIMGRVQTGRLNNALKLFCEMPVRDAICWNKMIEREELFGEMPEPSVVLWTAMIDGLFRFGQVELVDKIFNQMPIRDLAAWNAMLHGYCENATLDDAVKLFEQMPSRNVISWTSMIGGLDQNRNVISWTSMIGGLDQNGDVIAWTSRIGGLDQNGKSEEALIVLERVFKSGVVPDPSTLTCAFSAYANALSFPLGVQIHAQLFKSGFCLSVFVCASLTTFYANCKRIEKATQVFNEAMYRNVVICMALLTGCNLNGRHEDGLKVFVVTKISG